MKKFSKIKKNILRTMVKTPAQTDGWLKSFGQKTAQKSILGLKNVSNFRNKNEYYNGTL